MRTEKRFILWKKQEKYYFKLKKHTCAFPLYDLKNLKEAYIMFLKRDRF